MTPDIADLVRRLRKRAEDAAPDPRSGYRGPPKEALTEWEAADALESLLRQSAIVRALTIEEALEAQPSTAENPNEDAYQRGRFDGIMEFAKAILALSPTVDVEAMVGRGATALFREKFAADDTTCLAASATVNDVGEPYRSQYIAAARAVLSALGIK